MSILVISGNHLVRTWCQSNLQDLGFTVHTLDPQCMFDVLSNLRELRPDLVITGLKRVGGLLESSIRAIREDPVVKETPIIIFTSFSTAEVITRLNYWKISAYIIKPISVEAFQEQVVLEMHRLGLPVPDAANKYVL